MPLFRILVFTNRVCTAYAIDMALKPVYAYVALLCCSLPAVSTSACVTESFRSPLLPVALLLKHPPLFPNLLLHRCLTLYFVVPREHGVSCDLGWDPDMLTERNAFITASRSVSTPAISSVLPFQNIDAHDSCELQLPASHDSGRN